MDALLRTVIRRRETEAAVLSMEGDPAARMRCTRCGCVLVEDSLHLRCMNCRESSKRAFRANDQMDWERYVEERRALLERISKQVTELEEEMGAKYCSRPGCERKLRSDNRKGVCGDPGLCGGKNPPEPRVMTHSAPMALAAQDEPDAEFVPVEEQPWRTPPPVPALAASKHEQTLERFRMLARALDFNPDEVLAGFAQEWLERAAAAVKSKPMSPLEAVFSMASGGSEAAQ